MSVDPQLLDETILLQFQELHTTQYDGDGFWVLFSGFLVFFMHAGFAMLEAGSIQHKHKVNVLFKNVATVVFGGVAYFIIGFGFAFGEGENNSFLGTGIYAGNTFEQSFLDGTNDRRNFFFQFAFCVTSATIISGAVAGRIRLEAYLAFAVYITALVYPIVSHWAFSDTGFLSAFKGDEDVNLYLFADEYPNACGVFDFAGSGVVHLTGGCSALIAAIILGPRKGKFNEDGTANDLPAHNLSIATLGTFILWFGWYGFNAGSTIAFNGPVAAKVAVTTSLAPAAGCLTSIFVQKLRTGLYDVPGALNGILAGLVSVTAGCSVISDYAAIPIGVVGCILYIYVSELLIKVKIDDPVGAIPVHGACGIWGVLAVGIFATPEFVQSAYSCPNPPVITEQADWLDVLSGYQMLQQLIFVLCIIAWVFVTTTPVLLIFKRTGFLRVSDEDEELGLDIAEHGIRADSETVGTDAKEIEVKDTKEAVAEPEAEDKEEPKAPKSPGPTEWSAELVAEKSKDVAVGGTIIVEKEV